MKLPDFDYHSPTSLDEAITLMATPNARVLAGGQSLLPIMAFRLAAPSALVDLRKIKGLDQIEITQDTIHLGPMVRWRDVERHEGLAAALPLLTQAMEHVAHYQIRNRGTVGGSLAHADPASEWCLTAATLDATLVAHSASGRREIAARDYFEGAMATALRADEVLSSVRLPQLPEGARFAFQEFSRRSGDFAIAAALVVFELRDGLIAQARIGIGGAEDRPRRIPQAEAVLNGREPSQDLFVEAGAAVAAALCPMEDISTSAAYRRELAATLTERALEEAAR